LLTFNQAPSLKVELKQNVYASSHGSSQDIEDKSFLEVRDVSINIVNENNIDIAG